MLQHCAWPCGTERESAWLVCSFSIAALTHCHKFSGFNHTNSLSYNAGAQMSDMGLTGPRSGYCQGGVPLWRLQGQLRFLAFSSF